MTTDRTITQQLEETFQQATQSYVRSLLKSDRDLAEYETIMRAAEDKRDDLNRRYDDEYEARVEEARARLYDEAAQVSLDHPAPSGAHANRHAAINEAAQKQVLLAHQADLDQTRHEAQLAFEDLLVRVRERDQLRGMSTEAFGHATERRSGEDRRIPKQSQD